MNKNEIKVPDYIMDELSMGWAIAKIPVELDVEHAKTIIGLLVENDDSNDSTSQKIFDAMSFIRENGSYDYFYGVKTYKELAELIVQFDTNNDNKGYRASVYGTLPEEWAAFIDTNKLAKELEGDNRITLVSEWEAAVRIW